MVYERPMVLVAILQRSAVTRKTRYKWFRLKQLEATSNLAACSHQHVFLYNAISPLSYHRPRD